MDQRPPLPNQQPDSLASDQQYRALVESTPYAVLVVVSERVVFANVALCRLLGGESVKELLNRPPDDFIHFDYRETARQRLQRIIETGEPGPAVQELWVRIDGSNVEVETMAAPLPWSGQTAVQMIVRDVTERRRLERSLDQAQNQMRVVTEGVSNFAILGLDSRGRVENWNIGSARVFGYAEREIVGKDFAILFTPEDRASGAPKAEMKKAADTGVSEDERWHLRKDGSQFFAQGMLVSMRDDRGRLAGFTKVARDQTVRKLAEDALRESEARFRQLSNELERRVADRTNFLEQSAQTWESFCYSIAHDLRAPLRTISGFADALLDDYAGALDATGKDYAQRMMAAAHRLDEFIKDLLDFGRLAHIDLPRRSVPLSWAVQHVISELADQIRAANADIRVTEPLPAVRANPAALNQVISNLLSNAIKFVHRNVSPRVDLYAEEKQGCVRFWVRDYGIGISPEHRERIFRLFERLHTQSEYPGTGVGLAIVRKAMERMEGQAGIESVQDKGTAFWIELPKGDPR